MADGTDLDGDLRALQARINGLGEALPDVMSGFRRVMTGASKGGTLSPGLKELVAVTIAVAQGCEDCILFHLVAAKRHGASREELVELLGVAVEMGGGPSVVYASRALEMFDTLD